MRYFIVAGETSGDLHGAKLIEALMENDPQCELAFVGGSAMEKVANKKAIVTSNAISVMGYKAVLSQYHTIKHAAQKMQSALRVFQPDRIIAIDSSGFNFRYLLPFAHKYFPSVPLIYYIVPKLWAWRSSRAKVLKRYCSRLLVIFPFEETFFRSMGLPVTYVGNPTVDELENYLGEHRSSKAITAFSQNYSHIPLNKPIIALLPGSRKQELRDNLPLMLETVSHNFPNYTAVVAGAPNKNLQSYRHFLEAYPQVHLLFGATASLLSVASMAIVTSGTATLETALIGTPQVVCYRMNGSRVVNWAFKHIMKVKYFSLVNLVAQKPIVKELLGANATVANLTTALIEIEKNTSVISENYKQMATILGKGGASHNAAKAIIATKKVSIS